ARDLVAALPAGALLLAGSSRPIRDLEAYADARADITVIGNRGVSGIDGLISTTLGASLTHDGPAFALLGDLAMLHDHGGLLLGPGELRPDVTLVVADNDGGGIFSLLPPADQPGFDRIFGTPHGLDLAAVAVAAGWECTVLDRAADLPPALAGHGPRVVLARTRREQTAALHRQLQQDVSAALEAQGP
ncbi:MAG: 2-succinyl-5-enolpyruvyl-6-hydroxy-3-cyclohexene-1-carboxylate synthase, partial [Geodermatophilaceae bacterium]|nr:2-succinyl-5-enolpyruvyl-6-hydroxy-3-cyclohexene-1-carboxylate synthase [Geodermatophilaceae bacterium]